MSGAAATPRADSGSTSPPCPHILSRHTKSQPHPLPAHTLAAHLYRQVSPGDSVFPRAHLGSLFTSLVLFYPLSCLVPSAFGDTCTRWSLPPCSTGSSRKPPACPLALLGLAAGSGSSPACRHGQEQASTSACTPALTNSKSVPDCSITSRGSSSTPVHLSWCRKLLLYSM